MRREKGWLLFIIFSCIVFFVSVTVFAQSSAQLSVQQHRQPWWLTLEQGKLRFRNGDYGGALIQFEDARRTRRNMYEQMERDFIHLLSQNDVRRLGDALDRVEQYSRDRHHIAATAALDELYYRVPKSSFNNSAAKALEALGLLKDYPEAEYWIGEVYRIEGELRLALIQYRRAYEMRANLEDPGFSASLQYKIGSVLLTRQEYTEMEKAYLAIINEYDTLWINSREAENTRTTANRTDSERTQPLPYAQASASFATTAMRRILVNDGIGRFLELYRYNNTLVENAHRQLGFFFVVTQRPSAQEHLMYAFLIQNTIIIEEITRRQFDFSLSAGTEVHRRHHIENSARELILISEEIKKYPNLQSYVNEVEYYKTAYYLAASLFRNNNTPTALTIWEFLASQPQAGEWHSRSVQQLRSPRMEPRVDMP